MYFSRQKRRQSDNLLLIIPLLFHQCVQFAILIALRIFAILRSCPQSSRLGPPVTTTTLTTRMPLTSICWMTPCGNSNRARAWKSLCMTSQHMGDRRTGWGWVHTHGRTLCRLMSSMSEQLNGMSVSRLPKSVLISPARGLEWHCKSAAPDGAWQTITVFFFILLMYTNHSGTLHTSHFTYTFRHVYYVICTCLQRLFVFCLVIIHAHVCPPQKTVYGASVIIFEGIMAFADKKLLQVSEGYRPLRFLAGHTLTLGFYAHMWFFFILTPCSVVNASYTAFKIWNNWSNDNQILITVLELIYRSYVLIINHSINIYVLCINYCHQTEPQNWLCSAESTNSFLSNHAVDLILSPSSCFYF